ncbi:hypothetical protein FB45DRAFT_326688 [Roridomyces roridus]|uniref:Uncharacterized protein n=1 Tax=Roridomyces roridus TaxID=1738132 RepID=A0AAD7B5L4_9AGAR|nr:hypothetical protein FB45DRAFT_326688 [Roridomyces roridus]
MTMNGRFRFLALKLDEPTQLPSPVSMDWSQATGPSQVILSAWTQTDVQASLRAIFYVIQPPLVIPKDSNSQYQQNLYAHWTKAIDNFVQSPVPQEGPVAGNPELGIPAGEARLWTEEDDLKAWFNANPYIDPSAKGIRFLIHPGRQQKRRLSMEDIDLFPKKKLKEDSEQETLMASRSDNTDISGESKREEFIRDLQCTASHIKERMKGEISGAGGNPVPFPAAVTHIPFPALSGSEIPPTFELSEDGAYTSFAYRPCPALPALVEDAKGRLDYLNTEQVSVVGVQGSGKSHRSAALATALLALGLPAAFIVCSAQTRPRDIRNAIGLAGSASIPEDGARKEFVNNLLDHCSGEDPLLGFRNFMQSLISKPSKKKMIIIAIHLDCAPTPVRESILSMARGHLLYFSASANGDMWQKHHRRMALSPGYSEIPVELPPRIQYHWLAQYQIDTQVKLKQHELNDVMATTGGVPALLELFSKRLQKQGHYTDNLLVFLEYSDAIFWEMTDFYSDLSRKHPELDRSRISSFLQNVLNCDGGDFHPEMPDRRFIFKDAMGHWRYSNLLVFKAIVKLISQLEDGIITINVQSWVANIRLVQQNPSMVGFSTEYATNGVIALGLPLPAVDVQPPPQPLHIPRVRTVAIPSGRLCPNSISAEGCIYVPIESNFRYVDAVVVWSEGTSTSRRTDPCCARPDHDRCQTQTLTCLILCR